jgi:hypothetical protein
VLLYGVLEETHDITGNVVDATAEELAQDLEGMPSGWTDAPTLAAGRSDPRVAPDLASSHAVLLSRIERLERQMAEREQIFDRLTEMLGVRG